MTLLTTWIDRHREPQCEPGDDFPYGKFLDQAQGQFPTCETKLGCPAPRCGYWLVTCDKCGYNVVITTAGRVDDPNGIRVPCLRVPRGTKAEIEANHKAVARTLQENLAQRDQ